MQIEKRLEEIAKEKEAILKNEEYEKAAKLREEEKQLEQAIEYIRRR